VGREVEDDFSAKLYLAKPHCTSPIIFTYMYVWLTFEIDLRGEMLEFFGGIFGIIG
jgi:hypothetical protein